jgi:hypothetical protein
MLAWRFSRDGNLATEVATYYKEAKMLRDIAGDVLSIQVKVHIIPSIAMFVLIHTTPVLWVRIITLLSL